jgi:hypothetical protein
VFSCQCSFLRHRSSAPPQSSAGGSAPVRHQDASAISPDRRTQARSVLTRLLVWVKSGIPSEGRMSASTGCGRTRIGSIAAPSTRRDPPQRRERARKSAPACSSPRIDHPTTGCHKLSASEAPDPGRYHPGMMGNIISEPWAELSRNRWAASFRNHGRLAPESPTTSLSSAAHDLSPRCRRSGSNG